MNKSKKIDLGTEPIGRLLWKQSLPPAIGILSIAIYGIVDTIFVGRWVGTYAIAAIGVVLPLTFLIASVGMSVGVGGASIISRALGANDEKKASLTFGNVLALTGILSLIAVALGHFAEGPILRTFGARSEIPGEVGEIFPLASDYFRMLLPALPMLAFAMLCNNIMRAEGEAKMAMFSMLIPGVVNTLLDPVFIIWMDMGIKGAGLATSISYVCSAIFTAWYFFYSGRSSLQLDWDALKMRWKIIRETVAIGSTSFARQASGSLIIIAVNYVLIKEGGGEFSIAIFGLINRLQTFILFPIFGLTQGYLPITGFNYGARSFARVRETLKLSMISGTLLCTLTLLLIWFFAPQIISIFSTDQELISKSASALRKIFLALPLVASQLLGSAYFQALGKALPAFMLTISKQFVLIPLLFIVPSFLGIDGVWYSFAISDLVAVLLTITLIYPQWLKLKAAS